MKTKSSAKKRFKVTGSEIKRKHAFKSHILTKKSKKRKLALTHSALVHKTDMKSIKQQLRIIKAKVLVLKLLRLTKNFD
jgi:large subunit ribosomal protein L35